MKLISKQYRRMLSMALAFLLLVSGVVQCLSTSVLAAGTSYNLYAFIATNCYSNQPAATKILTSGALVNVGSIIFSNPGSDLLSVSEGKLNAENHPSGLAGANWVPVTYTINGEENFFVNGIGTLTQQGEFHVDATYQLNTGIEEELLNLPATLMSDAKTQKSTLDKLTEEEYMNYMAQLDKNTLTLLRFYLVYGDTVLNSDPQKNGALKESFSEVMGNMIENCYDPSGTTNNLKIYNLLLEYENSGLLYYYQNSDAFIDEIDLLSNYLTALYGKENRNGVELTRDDKIDAMNALLVAAEEQKPGASAYADLIPQLEQKMATVKRNLTAPNERINLSSPALGDLIGILETGVTISPYGSTLILTKTVGADLYNEAPGGDNTGGDNTGDDNAGGDNTGGDSTGDDNTGGDNTGDDNTGDDNTGGGNADDDNAGGGNAGDDNAGGGNADDDNAGGGNAGDDNTGGGNTGGGNTNDDNTGGGNADDDNTGGGNAGDDNTGGDSTGNDNTGDDNTGGDNAGNDNTGGSYDDYDNTSYVSSASNLKKTLTNADKGDTIRVVTAVTMTEDISVDISIKITGTKNLKNAGHVLTLTDPKASIAADGALNVASSVDGYVPVKAINSYTYTLAEVQHPETGGKTAGSKTETLNDTRYLYLDLDPVNGMTLDALYSCTSFGELTDYTVKFSIEGNTGNGLVKTADRLVVKAFNADGKCVAQISYVVIVMGDTNCNGKVNTSDAAVTKNISMGKEVTPEARMAADVNFSGTLEAPKVNSSDVSFTMAKWFAWDLNKYVSNLK